MKTDDETTKKTAPKKVAKKETTIYIGPNITGKKHIVSGTIYKNGLPGDLAEFARTDANFAALVIPVSQLGKAWQELNQEGSPLFAAYKSLQNKEV